MKLYWHPYSIMPWRVRIALQEKALDCSLEKVDVFSSTARSPEFLRLNPFGQIPVLEDDGLIITESIAILEYLEERYPLPALMPDDAPSRARVRELMCWGTDYWPLAWKKWMAPRLKSVTWTDESVSEGRKELAAHLDVLEDRLATGPWLVDSYSLADVCYAPMVLVLDRVGLEEEIAVRPGVSAWVSRLRERSAIRDTMMPT
jgi:glutathione S-transferase